MPVSTFSAPLLPFAMYYCWSLEGTGLSARARVGLTHLHVCVLTACLQRASRPSHGFRNCLQHVGVLALPL